ncbi:MAG: hypothetical protein QOI10_571 [Solirubrobacterales bacterium]|jgi:hypothetical protein|nr:hypothetical protein [Solirubrobacterales bacterium]
MAEVLKRRATALLAIVSLAAGAMVGSLAYGEGPTTEHGRAGSDVVIEPVAFQSDGGVAGEPVLELGGLTLRARCHDYGRGQVYLGVSAETAVDDAVAAVSFDQRKGADPASYAFVQSDFDRSYGEWDILGTNPDNTTGTLNYSRPDGGQVVVSFLADEATGQGECVFGGTATYAPAAADPPEPDLVADPSSSFAVSDAYLGVSCPAAPNSIACDRVALFVSTRDKPDYLVATIDGHRFRLDDAGWHREGSAAGFEGSLEVPGLLHHGPLAVAASDNDRWLGAPPVDIPILLQAVYRDSGTYGERLMPSVPLAAGYG